MDTTLFLTTKFMAIFSTNIAMAETTLETSEYQYETKDGTVDSVQFKTTIPKSLVQAMGWSGGDKLVWEVESGAKLSVEKHKD